MSAGRTSSLAGYPSYASPSPRRVMSAQYSGSRTPTLDAIRFSNASRTPQARTPHATSSRVAGSLAALLEVDGSGASPKSVSSSLATTAPGRGAAGNTAMFNVSMLEDRLAKAEERLSSGETQVIERVRDMLAKAVVPLEERIAELDIALQRQHEHFTEQCAELTKQLDAATHEQSKMQRGIEAQIEERVAAVAGETQAAISEQAEDLAAGLQQGTVQQQRASRELEAELRGLINEGNAALARQLETEIARLNEKYGDVCVGLDDKFSHAGAESTARVDRVVEDINRSLKGFEARQDQSMEKISAQVSKIEADVAQHADVFDAKIAEEVSTVQSALLEKAIAQDELLHDTSNRLTRNLDSSLSKVNDRVDDKLLEHKMESDERAANTARAYEQLESKLEKATEQIHGRIATAVAAVRALEREQLQPLADRVAPMEAKMDGFALRTEFKTSRMLIDMKLAEIIDTLKEMDSVIWEIDPGETLEAFKEDLQGLQVDLALVEASILSE